jgi:hypothetical protein
MSLQEVGWGDVDWIALADSTRALVNAVRNLWVP